MTLNNHSYHRNWVQSLGSDVRVMVGVRIRVRIEASVRISL